jgi:hypothetical protein
MKMKLASTLGFAILYQNRTYQNQLLKSSERNFILFEMIILRNINLAESSQTRVLMIGLSGVVNHLLFIVVYCIMISILRQTQGI